MFSFCFFSQFLNSAGESQRNEWDTQKEREMERERRKIQPNKTTLPNKGALNIWCEQQTHMKIIIIEK